MPLACAQSLISRRNFSPIGSNSAGEAIGLPPVLVKEVDDAAGRLQLGDVAVEVYPVRQEMSSVTCPATISAAVTTARHSWFMTFCCDHPQHDPLGLRMNPQSAPRGQ